MKDDVMLGDTPKARKRRRRVAGVQSAGRLWKHSRLSDLEGLIPVEAMEDHFIFTLVRNPWDRMVSYYHWLKTQRFQHPAVTLAQNVDFTAFLKDPFIQASLRNSCTKDYVTDTSGRLRARAFLRIEHFAQDAAPLITHLGFDLTLTRENTSDRSKDWRGYYTPETTALIATLFADDVKTFGYTFSDAAPGPEAAGGRCPPRAAPSPPEVF